MLGAKNFYIAGIQAQKEIEQYAKDFAKQMCDKQKLECTKVGYAMDAPYPKELI
jgi:hypothetical protein